MAEQRAALAALAACAGGDPAQAGALCDDLEARAGLRVFYVFRAGGGPGGGGGSGRARTILAFPSPDTAVSFAQRNGMTGGPEPVRLRRIDLANLLLILCRDPNVVALLLANDETPPPGRYPGGTHLTRDTLLDRIRGV